MEVGKKSYVIKRTVEYLMTSSDPITVQTTSFSKFPVFSISETDEARDFKFCPLIEPGECLLLAIVWQITPKNHGHGHMTPFIL